MSITPAALADLCAVALPDERLRADELQHVCFGPGDEVIGTDEGAVAVTTKPIGSEIAAWVLLVVVHPARQGRGAGKALMHAAFDTARERGARTVHLASAVPRYLWPGVDLANTRAGMLFETLGFRPGLVGINMTLPSAWRASSPAGVTVERETGLGAVEFAQLAYPHWVDELTVAIDRATAFAARDATGQTIGFACHSCNRAGWIGPMATDPTSQHRGIGSALLGAVCGDLETRGHTRGEVAWVSNLRFYGKCGAHVSRVFQGGSRAL